jgi:coenzyme PQQ synthesis protein D (PqqD)
MQNELAELAPYEHVVFTEFDGGDGILVDLNAKKYFQMNPTATLVWRALAAGRAHEQIIREMISEYEVETEQATLSLGRLLAGLQDFNLIGPRA